MADQGKWFKLWCSAMGDPDLENLDLENWARWAKLGTYIKEQGSEGKITFAPPYRALLGLFRVPHIDAAIGIIKRFPNVHIGERSNTVTPVTNATVTYEIEYQNWSRYQGDYSNDRVRKFRDKKRHAVTAQEEKRSRREEKRSITPSAFGTRELIDAFHLKLTEALKEPPTNFNGGVLGRLFKTALASHPVDDIKARIDHWFASTDSFIVGNGFSPTLFASKFPLLKGGPIHAAKTRSGGSYSGVEAPVGKYASITENR